MQLTFTSSSNFIIFFILARGSSWCLRSAIDIFLISGRKRDLIHILITQVQAKIHLQLQLHLTISDFWPKLVVSLLGFCGGIAGGHPATREELSENGFKDVNSEILSGECDQGEVLPPHYVDLSLC